MRTFLALICSPEIVGGGESKKTKNPTFWEIIWSGGLSMIVQTLAVKNIMIYLEASVQVSIHFIFIEDDP